MKLEEFKTECETFNGDEFAGYTLDEEAVEELGGKDEIEEKFGCSLELDMNPNAAWPDYRVIFTSAGIVES